jgi:hypothetical protein
VDLNLERVSLIYLLDTISQTYRIPIGFERSTREKDERKFNIAATGQILTDVLDSIIAQDPEYRWEINDEVINIIPVRNRSPFLEKFLAISNEKFEPPQGLTHYEMRQAILNLPKVSELLLKNKVKLLVLDSPGLNFYPDSYEVNMERTTTRSILNRLVRDGNPKIWVVSTDGKENDRLVVSF